MLSIALLVRDRYVLNETKIPLESEQQKTHTFVVFICFRLWGDEYDIKYNIEKRKTSD
jgi:hypothetical protein